MKLRIIFMVCSLLGMLLTYGCVVGGYHHGYYDDYYYDDYYNPFRPYYYVPFEEREGHHERFRGERGEQHEEFRESPREEFQERRGGGERGGFRGGEGGGERGGEGRDGGGRFR